MPAEIDFLNTLYTKLVEDELIELKIKNKLVSKLDEKINSEIKKLFSEESTDIKKDVDGKFFIGTAIISIMVCMLSFVIPLYKLRVPPLDTNNFVVIFITLISMVIALLFTQNILRQKNKETQESSPTKSRFREILDYENKVYKKIKNSGFSDVNRHIFLEKGNRRLKIDFSAKKKKINYYFEVKHFKNVVPSFILSQLNHIASEVKKTDKRAKLILITKNKVMSSDRTKNYLKNWDYILDESILDNLKKI